MLEIQSGFSYHKLLFSNLIYDALKQKVYISSPNLNIWYAFMLAHVFVYILDIDVGI